MAQTTKYIDPWDVDILKRWLKLAETEGTDAIKIVATDEGIGTYRVTVSPEYVFP